MADFASFLMAIATLISSISGLVIALRNHRAIRRVDDRVNGQSQQLLELTHTNAFKAGVAYAREARADVL